MRTLQRAILFLGGVFLALVLAEGVLQLARLANLLSLDAGNPAPAQPGALRVLCAGDSHTFGFGLHPLVQSYPVRLNHELDRGRGAVHVENLGFPGLNTAQVRERLRERLDAGPADAVVVLAGYNDSWNPARADVSSREPPFVLLRLWKLWRAGARPVSRAEGRVVWEGETAFVEEADGTRTPIAAPEAAEGLVHGERLQQTVRDALAGMVELCRTRGVPVILQTYVSEQNDVFRSASAAAREAARLPGVVALVDHAAWFREGREPAETILQPDGHPTALGCERMASALAAALRELPAFRDLPAGSETAAAAGSPVPLALELPSQGPDGTLSFRLRGPPEGVWQLVFSHRREPHPGGLGVALDEVFHACQGAFGLNGRFDEKGTSTAYAYPQIYRRFGPEPAVAQLLLLDPFGDSPEKTLRGVSPVVDVTWPAEHDPGTTSSDS